MSELPKDSAEVLVGVHTSRPVREASAEFGEKAVHFMVERILVQVRDRLHNSADYSSHGWRA